MDIFWVSAFWAVVPTVMVGLIFWIVMRSIIRADRTERTVYARIEAEERARLGLDARNLDARNLDAPNLDAPNLDAPNLDAPNLNTPKLDAPTT
jgi:hypothetical protein